MKLDIYWYVFTALQYTAWSIIYLNTLSNPNTLSKAFDLLIELLSNYVLHKHQTSSKSPFIQSASVIGLHPYNSTE